jgi:hypothetical protein
MPLLSPSSFSPVENHRLEINELRNQHSDPGNFNGLKTYYKKGKYCLKLRKKVSEILRYVKKNTITDIFRTKIKELTP